MADFRPANLRRIRWEYRSPASVSGIPVVHVALGGRDQGGGYRPGVARGIFAFGDIAIGLVAMGGVALGLVALGAVAIGLLAVGAVAIGFNAVGAVTFGLLLPPGRGALGRDSRAGG
ncbi:MAG TPA: hypothetical protein VFJ22_01365 [Dermatophilaceae bacterium]|nr:hypothetical protein [Dermatophilaceae bacterium]